ncbi:MAG: malonyl-CoA decarboxylase [Saprospiraceae bacterium]|jgi:malonyl-CoA decarboxylase
MSRLSFIQNIVPSFSETNWLPSFLRKQPALPISELCDSMMSSDGEYSSLILAAEILDRYEQMDATDKKAFFSRLATEYDLSAEALVGSAQNYSNDNTAANLEKLRLAATPQSTRFFQQLNQVPDATARLVKMRADLLQMLREEPDFKKLDIEMVSLFRNWFNRGFLEMRRIDWATPAHILEKIIAYEAVHEISSWQELRARVEPEDRLCFAFFHPAMDSEPLVFVEVALGKELPDSINFILETDREGVKPTDATHAIFYSISNCHLGLASVSFGNFLIKQVVAHLQSLMPQIKVYATLSPVPKFAAWQSDNEAAPIKDKPIQNQAAEYLLNAKSPKGLPYDPVERFHLKNGARLERINVDADLSQKGLAQSKGVMVNYVYDLKSVVENHEDYQSKLSIKCASQVKSLLK